MINPASGPILTDPLNSYYPNTAPNYPYEYNQMSNLNQFNNYNQANYQSINGAITSNGNTEARTYASKVITNFTVLTPDKIHQNFSN